MPIESYTYGGKDDQKRRQLRRFFYDQVETRIKTSFIYAIAEFETIFGDLWGHLPEDEMDDEQKQCYEDFQRFRKLVLDNGNNQIRTMKAFVDQFEITRPEEIIFKRNIDYRKEIENYGKES